jgi:hypothetical protein
MTSAAERTWEKKDREVKKQSQFGGLLPDAGQCWIPAPRFCGDKFTPAKAGAGMTERDRPERPMEFEKTKPICERIEFGIQKPRDRTIQRIGELED